ncbi:MAG: phage tail assembly protein [Coprobacillus sp.]|nr:phage tail assembly protein [Coprobacillus sp.]
MSDKKTDDAVLAAVFDESDGALITSKDVAAAEEDSENPYLIKFDKPFTWEDKTYKEIDLSGLEDLTGQDMILVSRTIKKSGGNTDSAIPEASAEYAFLFAARATKMPVEFFQALPAKIALKVRVTVMNFFYGEE